MSLNTTIVVGNPKLRSRTARAAQMLATALTGRAADMVIELAELGPALLGWKDPKVQAAVDTVARSQLVIFASPTFRGTYSGLLKLFLDQFDGGSGLQGVVAVPLMLGARANHGTASERLLKPVLVELGATSPAPGLFLLESAFEDGLAIQAYAERWGPMVRACASLRAAPTEGVAPAAASTGAGASEARTALSLTC
ncbi:MULTISPECIES: NADPH-dependent FMN reductase [unclassified Variovorax]|uniref:NADPH-dependent FMN reductase n=1 Tax=unclassified Variovorax TaxID=663243 RepID=UPI001BD59F6A|nr:MULTISPECIES: NAD(P)H-dependent oxidoreductase [unclassified Variovorax]